jgi:uncharacterized membrane protein YgdD (TMEM256/DUF423 family)
MKPHTTIAVGALWAAVGVSLGAFGAHALKSRLVESGHLATWETAVRYHVWHALALVLLGLWSERSSATSGRLAGWCFLAGSLFFSGSLYAISLGGPRWLGPLTPLGGAGLIAGWIAFALAALRSRE